MPYILRDTYGHEYPVTGSLTVGRDASHAIVLADTLASRFHATIWDQSGTLMIRDENSSNGTYVNQARVQQSQLRLGDQIRIGDSLFTVAAPPPPGPTPAATQLYGQMPTAPAPRRGRGCVPWLIAGCLVLILGCVVTLGAGFLAYQSGLITANTFLNLVGIGPADIEFDNFRDETLQVSILQLDVAEDQTPEQGSLEINAFDIHHWNIPNPGRYQVDFSLTPGGSELGTCTLTLKSGDQYQFVALPERIAVNRANRPSNSGPDFVVETSSLCR